MPARPEMRARPLPEVEGDELIRLLLAEIDEEERLSAALGVDLSPVGPDPSHAPMSYLPLPLWLRRSEEIHAFREQAWRAERQRSRR